MAVVARCLIFLVFLISIVQGRILSLNSSDDHLISDGVENLESSAKTNTASGLSTTSSCTHQYGFLPCAENTAGYIFLILMYQIVLVFGEEQIGSGSKVLFNIIGAGKIGGIIFRILMALPSMMLMIGSGIFSSKETAQSQVSVVFGINAGITVFSLTVQWGMVVIFARRSDLNQKSDENGENTHSKCLAAKRKLMILKDTGVKIDDRTCYTAVIMLFSLIPYITLIVLQLHLINTPFAKRMGTLKALIVSSLTLLSYFAFQISNPWMQQRSLDYSDEILQTGFLEYMQQQGQLVNEDGEPNMDLIKKLFAETDTDDDKRITKDELKTLVDDIVNAGAMKIHPRFDSSQVIENFDSDNDGCITKEEFTQKCKQWIETNKSSENSHSTSRNIFHKVQCKISACGKRAFIKSILQVLLGVVILIFLGGPLMSSILELSYAMTLPSFSISFVVVPFFMNLRVAIAALFPASQSERTASLTFSEIYGTVIMNNLSGMTALLAIIYAKDLTWDFSAEVLTIMVVCAVIGILAVSRTSYPLWTCILAFALYPFSLGLFYVAHVLLNWN